MVLEAIKIAIESSESVLSDSKFWSTSVDLLVNISMPLDSVYVKNASADFRKIFVFSMYKWLFEKTRFQVTIL